MSGIRTMAGESSSSSSSGRGEAEAEQETLGGVTQPLANSLSQNR